MFLTGSVWMGYCLCCAPAVRGRRWQWKALHETKICSASTAHARFEEWVQAGVLLEFWKAGLMEYDAWKGIAWEWLSMDGAMTKAPLAGEKSGSQPDRPGKDGRQAW